MLFRSVEMNEKAIDAGATAYVKIDVPADWADAPDDTRPGCTMLRQFSRSLARARRWPDMRRSSDTILTIWG